MEISGFFSGSVMELYIVFMPKVGLDFTPRFIKTELDKVSQREVFSRQVGILKYILEWNHVSFLIFYH